MKKTIAGLTALVLLVATTASGDWTTNKSSGTKQAFNSTTTTATVVPDSIQAGLTFASIANMGSGDATIYIVSSDISAGADTIPLGAGVTITLNCPHGIDTLKVLANASTLGFHVSN